MTVSEQETTLSIEAKGMAILEKWLKAHGRNPEKSDKKTFDLKVDGKYAELKAKKHGWSKFDFIGLTGNQVEELGNRLELVFVVLNVNETDLNNIDTANILEIPAEALLHLKNQNKVKTIVHYEWNKGILDEWRRSLPDTPRS